MIPASRESDLAAKQEGKTTDGKIPKALSASGSWSRLKDSRIVRVSRAFGGKDRHSKVHTVRGLRDRRVRLSVPTAIQLYDLQDRLGFNQPSKVVDWLLNAAKHEIDELPPLQMPPGNFGQNYPQLMESTHHDSNSSQSNKEEIKMKNGLGWHDQLGLPQSNLWYSETNSRDKYKEAVMDSCTDDQKEGGKENDLEDQQAYVTPNNHSSIPGLLNNDSHSSSHRWNPSNFSLSHMGSHGFTAHIEDLRNLNFAPLSTSLSLPSGPQLIVCPPGTAQSYFTTTATNSAEFDPKQADQYHMLSSNSENPLPNCLAPTPYSISQPMRSVPFHLSMAPKIFLTQNNSGNQSNNSVEFPQNKL